MEFDHDNVRLEVEEDRLTSLPDELLHKIMSCFDMKFAVQTCLLSSRWKPLWTSMPCLNFSTDEFVALPKFAKFVNHVLSHRNHQVEVSCVKLDFSGSLNQVFVRKIAKYAFSHNVQQLTVSCRPKNHHELPPCLFSSQSLKHFTLTSHNMSSCITPKTPWDFPALTSLNLRRIRLCGDLFSKCVNLKKLTLQNFRVEGPEEVFDIITPRLSNLTLIDSNYIKTINVIAPQLENLTISNCSIKYLNAPPGLLSFCYTSWLHSYGLLEFTNDGFHSLNKVSISLSMYHPYRTYKEEDARKTINMFQQLHSARYLTLNVDIIECLSSFPDLVSHHPSPFSNLIRLTIDSSRRIDAYKVKMSTEAKNFFLDNSPNPTFIMELPEKVKRAAEIDSHLMELKALIEQGNMDVDRKQGKEKANAALERLTAEMNVEVGKRVHTKTERLKAEFNICVEEMRALVKEEKAQVKAIISKEAQIRSLLDNLAMRERTEVKTHFFRQLQETQGLHERLVSEILASEKIFSYGKLLSDCFSTYQDND